MGSDPIWLGSFQEDEMKTHVEGRWREDTQRRPYTSQGEWPQKEPSMLFSQTSSPQNWEKKLSYKPTSLWHFAWAAPADSHTQAPDVKVYGSRSPHPDVDLVLTCSAWGATSYGHNPAAAELSTDSSVTQKQHFSGVLRLAVASGQLHVAARGDIFTQHSW